MTCATLFREQNAAQVKTLEACVRAMSSTGQQMVVPRGRRSRALEQLRLVAGFYYAAFLASLFALDLIAIETGCSGLEDG
jgi:hypothetical protein